MARVVQAAEVMEAREAEARIPEQTVLWQSSQQRVAQTVSEDAAAVAAAVAVVVAVGKQDTAQAVPVALAAL